LVRGSVFKSRNFRSSFLILFFHIDDDLQVFTTNSVSFRYANKYGFKLPIISSCIFLFLDLLQLCFLYFVNYIISSFPPSIVLISIFHSSYIFSNMTFISCFITSNTTSNIKPPLPALYPFIYLFYMIFYMVSTRMCMYIFYMVFYIFFMCIIIIIVLIYTARIELKSPFTPAVGYYYYYCGQILKLY
jgi:hypothetical protein